MTDNKSSAVVRGDFDGACEHEILLVGTVKGNKYLGITFVHGDLLGLWRASVYPPFGALPCHSYTQLPVSGA